MRLQKALLEDFPLQDFLIGTIGKELPFVLEVSGGLAGRESSRLAQLAGVGIRTEHSPGVGWKI